MSVTKFKDLLQNIEAIKNTYQGTAEELAEEEVCAQVTATTLPNTFVGIRGVPVGIVEALTFEFTRQRRLAKPAVAGRVQRRVGRHVAHALANETTSGADLPFRTARSGWNNVATKKG